MTQPGIRARLLIMMKVIPGTRENLVSSSMKNKMIRVLRSYCFIVSQNNPANVYFLIDFYNVLTSYIRGDGCLACVAFY